MSEVKKTQEQIDALHSFNRRVDELRDEIDGFSNYVNWVLGHKREVECPGFDGNKEAINDIWYQLTLDVERLRYANRRATEGE